MNDGILQLINSNDVSLNDLIHCIELIKQNGDVVVIKFDGERGENQYTAFITFPKSIKREMIRADESTLREALMKIVKSYVYM
jgi:hypothetical protein